MEGSRICRVCGSEKVLRGQQKRRGKLYALWVCRACKSAAQTRHNAKWRSTRLPVYLMKGCRERARIGGLPCTISSSDIQIPELCPVLGIPLFPGTGRMCTNSPTLDRLVPELGYVKGNVRVISWQANRLKSNATLAELQMLVRYMEEHSQQQA